MNYVIFRKFLPNADCQFLIQMLNIPEESKSLGLVDKEKSDTWYDSKRNPGMSYIYSTDDAIRSMVRGIKHELTECTGIEWDDKLSKEAVVFCKYGYGGVSNSHRDRDKTIEITTAWREKEGKAERFQKYTCIILLNDNLGRDEFYLNFSDTTSISIDGREVFYEECEQRFYPNLTKGDVIIFRNDISIHGVDKVISTDCRITTAFRSA